MPVLQQNNYSSAVVQDENSIQNSCPSNEVDKENKLLQWNSLNELQTSDNQIKMTKINQNLPQTDRTFSCHSSDCSFEMNSDDDNKCSQLRSIDELFASPPTVIESGSEEEGGNSSFDEENDDEVVAFQPVKFSPTVEKHQENAKDTLINNEL